MKKDNPPVFIDKNKEKASKLFQSIGLWLPVEETITCFDSSIAHSMDSVKPFCEKNDLTFSPVTINLRFSEHPQMNENHTHSLLEFDRKMNYLDREWVDGAKAVKKRYGSIENAMDAGDFSYAGYAKVAFELDVDGKIIPERQDIGDGYGGVVAFLKEIPSYASLIPALEQTIQYERNQERNHIGKELIENGFMPNNRLLDKIQLIYDNAGEKVGLNQICVWYKEPIKIVSEEIKKTVSEVGNELKKQELARMQAPER